MGSVSIRGVLLVLMLGLAAMAGGSTAQAQDGRRPRSEQLDGRFELTVGVGEIPILAGSFKPSISFGYHFNDYVYLGLTVQLRDVLERGSSSFNARSVNLDGLQRTREETGARSFLGIRLRPHRFSPYLAVGAVFNASDTERMTFQGADGDVVIVQTRPWGVRPAIGLGFAATLDSGFTFGVEFTGAWPFDPPTPRIEFEGDLDQAQQEELRSSMTRSFAGNWHNRYHLFRLEVGYAW